MKWKETEDSSSEEAPPIWVQSMEKRKNRAVAGQLRSRTAPGALGLQKRNSRPTFPREGTTELRPGAVS